MAAERAVCASNLSQQYMKLTVFCKENNSNFPAASEGQYTWDDELSEYLTKSDRQKMNLTQSEHPQAINDVFTCPSDKRVDATKIIMSYALNDGGAGNWHKTSITGFLGVGNENGLNIKQVEVGNPSGFVVVAESTWSNFRGQRAYAATRILTISHRYTSIHERPFFNNYSLADGSVQFMHVKQAEIKQKNTN